MQLGQDYFAYTLKKDLPFEFWRTYQAFKADKDSFPEQNLAGWLKI